MTSWRSFCFNLIDRLVLLLGWIFFPDHGNELPSQTLFARRSGINDRVNPFATLFGRPVVKVALSFEVLWLSHANRFPRVSVTEPQNVRFE